MYIKNYQDAFYLRHNIAIEFLTIYFEYSQFEHITFEITRVLVRALSFINIKTNVTVY